jgi:hypothetical protein
MLINSRDGNQMCLIKHDLPEYFASSDRLFFQARFFAQTKIYTGTPILATTLKLR